MGVSLYSFIIMGSNYITERFHKDIGMKVGKDYEAALLGKVDVNNPA